MGTTETNNSGTTEGYRNPKQPEYNSMLNDYNWKNQDFAELAAHNPKLNYQYTDGWWDKIGDFLGFRTQQDKVRDEAYAKAADYEAELMQTDREENYNSAEEQAQRMRDAGINPNLQGGVDAGQASEMDNQAAQGMEMGNAMSGEEAMQHMNNFIGTILSIATTGIGAVADIEEIYNTINTGNTALYDFVKKFIIDNPGKTEQELKEMISNDEEFGFMFKGAMKKKAMNLITSLYSSPVIGLEGLDIKNKTAKTSMEYGETTAHPYYSDNTDEIRKNFKPLINTLQKIKEYTADKNLTKAELDKVIWEGFKTYSSELTTAAKEGNASAVHALQALINVLESGDYKANSATAVINGILEGWKKLKEEPPVQDGSNAYGDEDHVGYKDPRMTSPKARNALKRASKRQAIYDAREEKEWQYSGRRRKAGTAREKVKERFKIKNY